MPGAGLADLPLRTDAWVQGLHMEAAAHDGDLLLRLLEVGFLPGERVRVVARAFPGGDPLAAVKAVTEARGLTGFAQPVELEQAMLDVWALSEGSNPDRLAA